jgi:hypothetical protein
VPKSIIPYEEKEVDADRIVEGLYVGGFKAGCNKVFRIKVTGSKKVGMAVGE